MLCQLRWEKYDTARKKKRIAEALKLKSTTRTKTTATIKKITQMATMTTTTTSFAFNI